MPGRADTCIFPQDQTPTLWFAEDGARIGRFLGHKGSVNTCDLTCALQLPTLAGSNQHGLHSGLLHAGDSSTLITASSDSRVKLWDVQTGECKYTFEYNEPCRAVAFSLGEQLAALTNDPFIQALGCIRIVRIAEDASEQTSEEVLKIGGSNKRFTRVTFHDLNRKLLTSGEDGFVRSWDVEVCTALHALLPAGRDLLLPGTSCLAAQLVQAAVQTWLAGDSCPGVLAEQLAGLRVQQCYSTCTRLVHCI